MGERGGENPRRLTSKKINKLDCNRTFNTEVSNKDRKTNGRFSGGNDKNEESEDLTSKRVKRKRSKNKD